MATGNFIFLLIYADLFIVVLSLFLLFKLIPPNKFFGFRTPKTMASKEFWYRANSIVAKGMLITSCAALILLLILLVVRKNIAVILVYSLGVLFSLVPYMVSIILTVFKIKQD